MPRRDKVGLGLGLVASQGPHNAVHTLSHQVLNMSLGMNPALITCLTFTQRLWNAVLDPVFGRFSDNLRTPFGRRRPVMLAAIVPLSLFFGLLWAFPFHPTGLPLFFYLLACSVALYTCISAYSVALGGLQIAAAETYHERTRVAGFSQLCFLGFTVAVQWVFPTAETAGGITGLRTVTGALAVVFLGVGIAPVFLVREHLYSTVASRQRRIGPKEAVTAMRGNPAFLRLIAAQGIISLGFFLASPLGTYLNYYYLFPGDIKGAAFMQAWLGTGFQVAAFCSVFAFGWLSRRFGKPVAFQVAAALHLLSSLAKLFAYDPAHPWYQLVVYLANGAGFAGVDLLAASMLADLVDLDEWQTGARTESVYWSVQSLFDKSCGALGTLISGFVIVCLGFKTGMPDQAQHTLRLMQLFYAGFPLVGAAAGLMLIRRFPITEQATRSIRAQLLSRRASTGAAADGTA